MRVLVLIAGMVLALVPTVYAAPVYGLVQDPTGALVPGADVALIAQTEAASQSSSTDEKGSFTFSDVAPGTYKVSVQRQGFETAQQSIVVAQSTVELKFILKLATQEISLDVDTARSSLANNDPVYTALRSAPVAESCVAENIVLRRDAGTLTFRIGTLSFTAPIQGRHMTAVFVGEGNFHLESNVIFERQSILLQTHKPDVTEPFNSAVLLFTDGTYGELKTQCKGFTLDPHATQALRAFRQHMRHRTENPRSTMEYLFAGDGIVNLDAELLSNAYRAKPDARFAAYIHGTRHSDLRFLIDPHGAVPGLLSPEEVALVNVDPVGTQDGIWYMTHYQDEWTAGNASSDEDKRIFALNHFKIDTTLGRNDHLASTAEVRVQALRDGDRVMRFTLLANLRVSRVTMAGKDVPFIQEPRRSDAGFYVVLPEPTKEGAIYTLTMEYEGNKVVHDEGGGSYSVGARESWYPGAGFSNDRASFDLTFRVPKGMTLVSIGKQTKAYRDQDLDVTEWSEPWPVSVAGFNYGFYKGKQVVDEPTKTTIEAWATRDVPDFLKGFAQNAAISPASMAQSAMTDGQNALRIFTHWFGPLPFGRVALTQ
jgi:hypothetical protein